MNNKTYKKVLLTLIILVEVFALNVQQTKALGGLINSGLGMVGISPAQILEQVAEDLQFPLDMTRDLMKYASSIQKKMASMTPTVETHFFPPKAPKIGEVVIMKAFPQNFSTDGEALHYIWALKHNDPNRNGTITMPGFDGLPNFRSDILNVHNGNIDWNGNSDANDGTGFCDSEEPDIQDCILEATRMRAQGTTKPGGINMGFDYDTVGSNDNDGYRAMIGGYNEIQENSGHTNNIQGGEGEESWLNANFPRGQRPPGPKCYVPDLRGSEVGGTFELASIGEDNTRAQEDENGQAVYYTEDGVCEDVVICASPAELDCGDFEDPGGDMGEASTTSTGEGGSGGDGGTGDGGGGGGGGGDSSSSATVDLEMPDRTMTGLPYAVWANSGFDISCSLENNDEGNHTPICPQGTTPICIDEALLDPTSEDYPDCREIEAIANGTNEGSAVISGGATPTSTSCYHDGRALYRFSQPGSAYCGGGACSITINGTEYSIPSASDRYDPGTGFVWKPVSESDGNLVVLVPSDDCSAGEAIRDLGLEITECDANASSVSDVENQCEQAFYGLLPNPFGIGIDEIANNSPFVTGEFNMDYERFFGLDPLNASTAGNGLTDGQNVAGLNADQFSWEYTPGDQISLITSGKSGLLGPHDDAKSMNMFALPKNNFSAFNFVEDANRYTVIDAEGHPREIPTIPGVVNEQSALLSSMGENWLNPASGHQAKQISVNITYQPKSPISSSVAGQSSILTVNASVEGMNQNVNQLKYKWEIYTGSQKYIYAENMPPMDEENRWQPIDGDDLHNLIRGPIEGVGLDTLKLNLNNFPAGRENHKYILARVKVSEYFERSDLYENNAGSLDTQLGFGDKIIEIDRSNSNFSLIISGENGEDIEISPIGGENGNIYPILNNQIVTAVKGDTFLQNVHWTLNGKTIDVSGDNNSVSFPASGRVGDKFVINMTGNNLGMTDGDSSTAGNIANVSKVMIIVEPKIVITMSDIDPNTQTIGDYEFLGSSTPDYRQSVYTFSGNAVQLTIDNSNVDSLEVPQTIPSYLFSQLQNIRWYADGVLQENCVGEGCNVNFLNAPVGSFHTVAVEADYVPSNREGLLREYGISRFRSGGEHLSAQIKLKVEAPAQMPKKKSEKVFASLIAGFPSQIMFLFRILLTIAVIIAVPGFVFSFEKSKA